MNKMQFAGVINSEETVSGLLPDGRRIYVQILSVYPMPTVEQGVDPLYWLGRLENGDFEDEENDPIVWVEPASHSVLAEQALEPTWQEQERLNDQERLAYCGYED
jgi:hypothetical protein